MGERKLQPTLWRTCRALANRRRLRMFALLVREPDLSVSQVAYRLQVPRSIASMYLRALESRGLIEVHRAGKWARYRVKAKPMEGAAGPLVSALVTRIRSDAHCLSSLYRLATAFVNPGRIEVFRQLSGKPLSIHELRLATGISARTLFRHVRKLQARAFLTSKRSGGRKRYIRAIPQDAFGRALVLMATMVT